MMNFMEDNNINNGNLNTDSQNVYTVGSQPGDAGCNDTASAGGSNGTSCGNGTGGSYTPPGCGDYRSGEYSYKGGEKIPEYRYTYSNKSDGRQSHAKGKRPKGKKPGRSHTAVIVTLVIVAAMLMGLLAGIAGTMIARYHDDNRGTQGQVQDTTGNTANQGQDPGPNTSSDQTPTGADVVIIKNDGSVTVKTVKGQIGDESLTVPDVVALVKNSVVEIFTEQRVYSGWYVSSGAGSGVIIGKSEDGKRAYVVTNNHVIADADTVNVRLADGTKYTAEVVGTDSVTDVAVVSIEVTGDVTPAELGSSAGLVVGESVIAIGNPLGELGGTVTTGIISALAREVSIDNNRMVLLQTNAAVNPGNSGGGLFNMKGELIGVVNAKSSGTGIENIGFAIPVDTAYPIITELIRYGYVTGRPTAGLTMVDITDRFTAMRYGLDSLGVYVVESEFTDSIKNGDRIVAVNGTKVSSEAEVKSILGEFKIGDRVTFSISRKGTQYDVDVTLREDVPDKTGTQ